MGVKPWTWKLSLHDFFLWEYCLSQRAFPKMMIFHHQLIKLCYFFLASVGLDPFKPKI